MLVEVKVPQLSESVAEATLVSWHKKVGEYVKRDENLVDIETDKVVLETPAPESGVLVKIVKGDGGTVASKEVIAHDRHRGQGARQCCRRSACGRRGRAAPAAPKPAAAPAMPAAQKLAAEKKLDTGAISGTGRGGRVTKGDVHWQAAQPAATAPAAAPAAAPRARRRRRWTSAPSASGPSSACRCRACARASPNGWCSRSRRRRS